MCLKFMQLNAFKNYELFYRGRVGDRETILIIGFTWNAKNIEI